MKVINGKFESKKEKDDLAFRSALKKVLKEWFDLRLKDFPTIIKKLGIEDKNYKVTLVSNICSADSYMNINITTENQVFSIYLNKGTILSPYPYLTYNYKEYYIGRKVEVEEITIPETLRISKLIYTDDQP